MDDPLNPLPFNNIFKKKDYLDDDAAIIYDTDNIVVGASKESYYDPECEKFNFCFSNTESDFISSSYYSSSVESDNCYSLWLQIINGFIISIIYIIIIL